MTALELSRASARTDALFRAHHDEVYRTLLRDLGSPGRRGGRARRRCS